MNNAINYSGFIDIDLKSDEEFEPYGYSEADARPEPGMNISQSSYLNDFPDE